MTITPDEPLTHPDVHAYLDDWTNDAGLRHLVGRLSRDEPLLEGGTNWVTFLADDAQIDAAVKPGMDFSVLSIDAHLLSTDDPRPSEGEVRSWVARQPRPVLGTLGVGSRVHEQGDVEYLPVLSADVHVDSVLAEFVRELILPFAEAWDSRTVARATDTDFGGGDADGGVYRHRPTDDPPRNAWLLMGSEASYPTDEELRDQWAQGEAGIFEDEWTAPKNGELGDLVLVYFVAPRKAACFVARLASRPYWQTDVEVNAVDIVDPHQWWAVTTPFVEIEPIPYQSLEKAAGGHLPLRGRSGRYLSPGTIGALTFTAKDPSRQPYLDNLAQTPTGSPDLPEWVDGLDAWKAIPGGALPLEAKVSEYIVEPIARLLWGPPEQSAYGEWLDGTLGPIAEREVRVPSGLVDFVFRYDERNALAIEVKLTIVQPASGIWVDSPDFQQLLRYMRDLDLPGMLVDAQRLILVKRGAEAPFAEIARTEATWNDIALIRELLLEARTEMNAASPAARPIVGLARRILRRG